MAYQLDLFGETWSLDQDKTVRSSWNGFDNRIEVRRSPPGKPPTEVRVLMAGAFPFAPAVTIDVTFAVRVDGSRILLDNVKTVNPANLITLVLTEIAKHAGGAGEITQPLKLDKATAFGVDPAFGFWIYPPSEASITGFILRYDKFQGLLSLKDEYRTRAGKLTFALNTYSALYGIKGAVQYKLADALPPDQQQLLSLSHVHKRLRSDGQGEWQLHATPDASYLLIGSDSFVKSGGLLASNPVLHNFVLANGALVVNVEGTSGNFTNSYYWRGDRKTHEAAVLALRMTDEHGLPLAICTHDAGFRLRSRTPAMGKGADGILLTTVQAKTKQDVRIRSIDLASIGQDRMIGLGDDRAPRWLVDGRVPLANRVPFEVHGLARGMRMCRTSANTEPSGWAGKLGTFVVPHADGGKHVALEMPELVFDRAKDWNLTLQVPERSIYEGKTSATTPAVTERVAHIAAAETTQFTLPLLDAEWALANLIDPGDVSPVAAAVVSKAIGRLRELDRQLTPGNGRVVLAPKLGDSKTVVDFAHVGGARANVMAEPDFHCVFSDVALAPNDPAQTALRLPQLKIQPRQSPPMDARTRAAATTFSLTYLHGGSDNATALENARRKAERAFKINKPIFDFFRQALLAPIGSDELRKLLGDLKQKLGLDLFKREDLGDGTAVPAIAEAYVRVEDTVDAVATGTITQIFPDHAGELETILDYLRSTPSDEIIAEILAYFDNPKDFDTLGLVYQWFLAPPSTDSFRRVVSAVADQRWLEANFPDAVDRDSLKKLLFGSPNNLPDLALLTEPLEGFLSNVMEGVNELYSLLVRLWSADATEIRLIFDELVIESTQEAVQRIEALFADLRARYGPVLTSDVYARLLKAEDDARAVTRILVEELARSLTRLADIPTEPPEYFVMSRRLAAPAADQQLWNHTFDLCRQGGTPWSFFLDTDSVVVVKTAARRPISAILAEIQAQYRADGRDNALGVPDGDLDAYLGLIAPDVRDARDWIGVFIVRPTADIARDDVVSTMTGLSSIEAVYVALGGKSPKWSSQCGPYLDVIGRIRKVSDAAAKSNTDARDVDLSLVSFDVTIRNTAVAEGAIAVRLDLVNLFGATSVWKPELNNRPIFIRAVLPPVKDADHNRSFEFGAFFDEPLTIDIDILCVKSFAFRSLRAVRHGGDVGIDIDGDINLDKTRLPFMTFAKGVDKLRLQDFRIRLPALNGNNIRFGAPRSVSFDFPAVSIPLPATRGFNIFGLDIIPRGLGFLRLGQSGNERLLRDLQARFQGIGLQGLSFNFDDLKAGNFTLPTFDLSLDFGKLPGLGGGSSLKLDMILGMPIDGTPKLKNAFVAITGLDARDIKIDLFRLLTLEFDRLQLSNDYQAGLGAKSQVGLLRADKIRLKLLDWQPFGDARIDFLYLNRKDPDHGAEKAWMVSYKDEPKAGGFLRLYGLVLAKGMELEPKVYNYLLESQDTDPKLVLSKIIDDPGKLVKANIDGGKPWLFAITFGLGDIFDNCALVLQDGRYYGIRISADWVQYIFDSKSIALAYIPGQRPALDRFRVALRCPKLDLIANMRSGEVAFEWGVNQDFLVDVGFPWHSEGGYDWFRSFSVPAGIYEAKFGFYVEKRTYVAPDGVVGFGAGFALYAGYFWGGGNGVAWLRAGIGVFAILEGHIFFNTTAVAKSIGDLKDVVERVDIVGVIGILAYGEGGIDYWVISARFRVYAQASVTCQISLARRQPTAISYTTEMAVGYSASVRIGCGFFSWTFSVSGSLTIGVSGRLLLG